MKKKVSDYIAQLLVENGIKHMFTVTGGGAMHLNDSFGHHNDLKCIYNHHEQACAIAAESYARINNEIAAVCVTTGPGGTNAITGVLGGYLDSIPMLVISGQVRYDTTARSTGLNLRAMGDQEFDITKAVDSMTKYCEMVTDPQRVRYCLEKALYIAQNGRPGPCWIDIPLNIQGAYIETDDLEGFNLEEYTDESISNVSIEVVKAVIEKIKHAKRPVLYAGNGIRIAKAHKVFMDVVEKLNIPVVTTWNGIDEIHNEYPLYTGRAGIMGDRAGNFAVQNSDLILSIGNRLSIRQVGYNHKTWAREAYVIVVDVDGEELKKPLVHIEMPIQADAKNFLETLCDELKEDKLFYNREWLTWCTRWKERYPVVTEGHYEDCGLVNVYAFIDTLSNRLTEDHITVVSNGSACVVGSQAYAIKKNSRFIINSGVASMGYGLPAAIGACIASEKQEVICIEGDGSIQMNLQELQTIIHHRLPIKIFVINNQGYHSIRQTQSNFFGEPLVGVGEDSGDLSFPDMNKLAFAYGYTYLSVNNNKEVEGILDQALGIDGPIICEVFVSRDQKFEPKSATKRLDDGRLVSAPLEDLMPFLSEEELRENMLIELVQE